MKNYKLLKPRSKVEQIGFWIIVAAAGLLLVVLLATVLGPTLRALGFALVMTAFVALITGLNSRALADRANTALGARIFPVVRADEGAIRRLVQVNGALTFAFAFTFSLLSNVFGPILTALVIAGLIALAIWGLPRLRRPVSRVITPSFTTERPPQDHVA